MSLLELDTWASPVNWVYLLTSAVVVFFLADHLSTMRKRKSLPGPLFAWPFFGAIFEMVWDPTRFWDRQETFGPLSWNAIFGKFMVFSRDTDTSIKIFKHNSPEELKIVLHPNAVRLLGEDNIAFMQGPGHKELRKRLLPLFTKKALGVYLNIQEKAIREHLANWVKVSEPQKMRDLCRDLNVDTSQSVFIGPYLSADEREEFAKNYMMMNEGFLAFPLCVPGTALWRAVQARKKVVATLTTCAKLSKERMNKGIEPECLLDFWMEKTVAEIKEAQASGAPAPPHSSDHEVACTTLDFLFASQDASTASLVWTCGLALTGNPDVLEKVRAEQLRLRPNDDALTTDVLGEMPYTNQVVMELLRYRPPATLVPHIALKDFQLTDEVNVPEGSLVVPSVWGACHQGYTNPNTFDPDRFSQERGEDRKYGKNFLTFGSGPHYCLGKQYAINHLMSFLSIMSVNVDMSRHLTPESETIVYGPTIFPGDGVIAEVKEKKYY
jgi:cytochrome P450 family 710 subfamily A protein